MVASNFFLKFELTKLYYENLLSHTNSTSSHFILLQKTRKKIEVFNKPIITSENSTDRFFPKEKTVEKFDTLIVDKNLEISITKSYSDSFVTNEFENEGKKQVDKYRDAEISLKIKQDNKILLDTLFKKENFNNYIDKNFQKIAVFHGY